MVTAGTAAEPDDRVETLADLPFHVRGRHPKAMLVGRCQGDGGAIEGLSSEEVLERVRDLSLGLTALGVSRGDRVAIVSESRPEWLLADLAILTAGAVSVPVYPTLSAAQVRYILQDSGARAAIVSNRTQLDKLREIRDRLPALSTIVVVEGGTGGEAPSVLSLDELGARGHARMTGNWGVGREFRDATRGIRPTDLAAIIYTSGTTGDPKGVMLSHANMVSNMRAGADALDVTHEDVALSFLPLSHSFERIVSYIYLFRGVTTVFAESLETVARDIKVVRPTLMTGVPRVYEKLHARIVEKGTAGSGVKARIFTWAAGVGSRRGRAALSGHAPRRGGMTARLADRLVFRKVREALGGRIRYLVSGSAPLPPALAEFFHGVGLPIIEGYGLTETSPILAVNPTAEPRAGSVGKVLPGVELRIAADGEILARGPNVMIGYYNKPDETAAVLRDGWCHTGDIGTLDADGYLRITDRKKDLLVTSGGKKVAPQPIEALLKRSPLVAEAVLVGDGRKFIAALVVPDLVALERRLQELGRPADARQSLVTRPDVLALYQEVIDALNRDLAQFEQIKKIALLPIDFSQAGGELTPTLKVRRKVVESRWLDTIDALYH